MEKYLQLKAELEAILKQCESAGVGFTPEQSARVAEIKTQMAALKTVLDELKAAQDPANQIALPTAPASAASAVPAINQASAPAPTAQAPTQSAGAYITTVDQADKQLFPSAAHQLAAIRQASIPGGVVDPKLIIINNKAAASGVQTSNPNEGGYFLEDEFSKDVIKAQWEVGEFSSEMSRGNMSGQRIKLPYLKNFDRSVSGGVAGGVRVFTKKEAEQYTKSQVSIGTMDYEAHKLTALFWETDEMSEDIPAMQSLWAEQMPIAFADKIDYLGFWGSGTDELQGILDAACAALVTVAKESGQAADSIVLENILKMFERLPAKFRRLARWYVDIQVETALQTLKIGDTPIMKQPGDGLTKEPYGYLLGIPVKPFDHCSSIGDVGDIVLAVPSHYKILQRTALNVQNSIHVRFEYGEKVWRAEQRLAGKFSLPAKYKRPNSFEQSTAITLAARA